MAELAFERLTKPKAREKSARIRAGDAARGDVRSPVEQDTVLDEQLLEWLTYAPDPGEPIAPALRADLERRLGRDFSHVRIHTGERAERAVAAAGATAFTRGAHIFLGSPRRTTDVRLLAHELTHVVQQGAAPPLRLAAPTRSANSPRVPRAAPTPATAVPGPAPAVQRENGGIVGTIVGAGRAVVSGVRRGASAVAEGTGNLLARGRSAVLAFARQIAPDLVTWFAEGGVTRFLRNLIAQGVSTLINRVLVPLRNTLAFDNLANRFGAASTALSETRATLERQICEGVLGAARRVKAFFSETFGPVVDWFRGMADTVSKAFNDVWDKFGAPVIDWLRQAGGRVWEGLQGQVRVVLGWIRSARAALGDAWDTVKSWLGIEAEEGESEGGGFWNWIRDKASEVGGAISDAIRPVLGPLRTAAGVLLLFVPGGQLVAVILLWPQIRQAFDWLSAQWENLNLIPRAREFWAHTLLPQLMDGAERLGMALVDALEWAVGLLAQIGNAVARAIAVRLEGILEPLNALVDFVHAEFTRMIEWMRSMLRAARSDMRGVLNRLIALGRTILDGLLTLISIVANPFGIAGFLLGTVWLLIPDCLKGPFIEFILGIAISFIQALPPSPLLGLLWPFVREAVLGFLERVQRFGTPQKVAVSNQLARIIAGLSSSFFLGYLRGMALGLWDLVSGPFQALVSLFELPTLIQNFLGSLGLRLCELIERIRCFAAQLAGTVFGGLDRVLGVFSEVLENPGRILDLIRCAIQGLMATVRRLGATLAERLMAILQGPEDTMGEMLGRVTANLVGNALITYFTAGVGTAAGVVGRIATALRSVGTALRQSLGVLRGLFGQVLGFVRRLASRFGSAAASGARSALGGIGRFLGRVGRFFGRLFGRAFGGLGRRFRLTAAERLQWAEFRASLRARLAGHTSGIRRSQLRQLYRGVLNGFRRVAKWPAFITKHGPYWRLWVRRVKSLRPRRVGRVLLDPRTRLDAGMREVKRTVRRLRRRPGILSNAEIRSGLPRIERRYLFRRLTSTFNRSDGKFHILGVVNPSEEWTAKPEKPDNRVTHRDPGRAVTVDPVGKVNAYSHPQSWSPWQEIPHIKTRSGRTTLYVRGHLAHGKFAEGAPWNLAPITRSTNARMYLEVERRAISKVRETKGVIKYQVTTEDPLPATLRQRRINGVCRTVPEEHQLVKAVRVAVTEYDPTDSGWTLGQAWPPIRIPNVPDYPEGEPCP